MLLSREKFKWRAHENESIDIMHRGGIIRSSDEVSVMDMERRDYIVQLKILVNLQLRRNQDIKAKSYCIPKQVVYEAWKRVKSNKGSAGVDNESIADYEKNLQKNLYRLWNRMSSGSYFPSPVRLVEIEKEDGKKRPLGIPTVNDRIGQMVCKMYLEPLLEKYFHEDSYGYRPGKSAHQAISKCRSRCWYSDWVIDLDIKGFFDNLDHELVMKAVKHHTAKKWIILYVERWLKAPVENGNGEVCERKIGTPQGGVISPLLANLFLHYCFDKWMEREFKDLQFERYADDCIIHCKSERQAKYVLHKIAERFKQCQLELHPLKTKIVYCKDSKRHKAYEKTEFDFLGYTFKGRSVRMNDGRMFTGFNPAISTRAKMKIKNEIRKWRIHRWISIKIQVVAKDINPKLSGWINYYGKYYKSELYGIFRMINVILMKWVRRKYSKTHKSFKSSCNWLKRIYRDHPKLFAHWCIAKV